MRIAFTSCCLLGHDHEQITWQRIGRQNPDWLILMGDNIYMDYFPDLNAGERLSDKDFGLFMQSQYQAQFTHPSFNRLIRGEFGKKPQILATWDDHDFAWNESFGEPGHAHSVPPGKKKIARALFKVFLDSCRAGLSDWPLQNIERILEGPSEPNGIYESADLHVGDWHARILMLDGRYHRRKPPADLGSLTDLLGGTQVSFLREHLFGNDAGDIKKPDLAIVVSGTTLHEGSESWRVVFSAGLQEFLGLTDRHGAVIVLSGDIHETRFNQINGHPRCIEVVASGAGIKKFLIGGMRKNFGMLTLHPDRRGTMALFNKVSGDKPAGAWELSYDKTPASSEPTPAGLAPLSPCVTTITPLQADVDEPIPEDLNPLAFTS